MSVAWTLDYNGTERPLASWNIKQPVLTFRNLDVDDFTFSIPRSNVLAEPTFPVAADIVLKRDGVGWFRGRVAKVAAMGNSRTEGDSYLVRGPWWRLQRTVYQQLWCINGAQQYTPRVTLGQDEFGRVITVGAQVYDVIWYALTKSIPISHGVLPVFQKAWLEEARDLTCAGVILRVLRFTPDAGSNFDYTAAAPALNIRQRADMPAVNLDVTAADRIYDFSGLSSRDDLVPAGVTFIYIGTEEDVSTGRTKTTITRDGAGIQGAEGSIVAVIDLVGGGHEAPPSALALAYYTALQTVQYEGTIRILEEECTGDLRPGKVVNISNGRAAWATMRAMVQTVTEELDTGVTVAELGAPEHLAPQDFIQQQQLARRRVMPTAFPRVQMCTRSPTPAPNEVNPADPGDAVANDDAGIDPGSLEGEDTLNGAAFDELSNTVDIRTCANGVETCVRVFGVATSCP